MASRRVERVSEVLKQAISEIITHELNDPRMGGSLVTVTRVEPSPDLKSAKVYVSVLGEEGVSRRTMQGLRSAAGFVRRSVGRLVTLRSVPTLQFVADDSIKRSIRISRIIADALAPQEGPDEETRKSGEDE
jgi:ribosome-binding factor A